MARKFPSDGELKERLLSRISVDDQKGCWLWTASLSKAGYGQISIFARPRLAHRVAYMLFTGPIPEGRELDHLCRNRNCINPDHLEPVTRSENNRRGLVGKEAARRARERTHCRRGHLLDAENVLGSEKGRRLCKTCYRAMQQGIYARKRVDPALRKPNIADIGRTKTHCPKGHPYSGTNLILSKKGSRLCRECMREASREYQRKKRGYYDNKISTG